MSAWTNWPRVPETFVPVQLQLATYLAQGRQTLNLKTVGEPLLISLEAAAYSPQVEIVPPDGSRVPLTVGIRRQEPVAPAGANGTSSGSRDESPKVVYEEAYKSTDQPGVYALRAKRQDGSEETRRFAYNVSDAESHLQLAPTDGIRKRLGADAKVQIQEAGDFNWVHGEESTREIHDYVLMALLIILLAEQAMALRLSYHPKVPGGRA